MSAHSIHPDTHMYGLADRCARCAEHAANPFRGLDAENLRNLADRCDRGLEGRSENEATAMAAMRDALDQARYLAACGVPIVVELTRS